MIDSPFAVLGAVPGATLAVVRAKYRSMASVHHPDRGGSESTMADINAAFSKISSDAGIELERSTLKLRYRQCPKCGGEGYMFFPETLAKPAKNDNCPECVGLGYFKR